LGSCTISPSLRYHPHTKLRNFNSHYAEMDNNQGLPDSGSEIALDSQPSNSSKTVNTCPGPSPPIPCPELLRLQAEAKDQLERAQLDYNWADLAVQSRGTRGRRMSNNSARSLVCPRYGSEPDVSHNQQLHLRGRSQTNPLSVLHDHEVPYVEAFGHIPSVGSATGTPLHSPSSDGVNAAGYPVPADHPFYHEMIAAASSNSSCIPGKGKETIYGSAAPQQIPPFFDPVKAWIKAIDHFTNGDVMACLNILIEILQRPETTVPHSRIHYNCGIIWSRSKDTKSASISFEKATSLEPSLTIAWYCQGVCNYTIHRVGAAMSAYDKALGHYKGDFQTIDFSPIGLSVQLQKTQIAFDRDLCVGAFGDYNDVKMFNMEELFRPVEDSNAQPILMMDEKPMKKFRHRNSVFSSIHDSIKRPFLGWRKE